MNKVIYLVFILALLLPANLLLAQGSTPPSTSETKKFSDAEALSIYPKEIRSSIYEALNNPGVLVSIAVIQSKSSAAFKSLISGYPQKTQQQFWQLIKYPKLITELQGDPKAYKNYPKEIQPIAAEVVSKYYDILPKIDAIDNQPQIDFQNIINGLAPQTKAAFTDIIQHPEVLNIIIQHLILAQTSETAYKQNPAPINSQAQAFAAQIKQASVPPPDKIATQKGDNPQVIAELQNAENSLDKNINYEQNVDPHPKNAVQMNVNYAPYPFYTDYMGHFSYPVWYGFPLGY